MDHPRYIQPPEHCTGCALCANVCPRDTIRMIFNNEGFLVPQVDIGNCINCGLCVKMCPAQPGHLKELYSATRKKVNPIAYGGWHTQQDTHVNSSSGGIFSALSEWIFSRGGCVYGVVWRDKCTASFCKAENMRELAPMRGSKYTQAVPEMVYREVKTELKRGRYVLFVGTGCQVYALQKYLRQPCEKLLTVDIICAGVPSRHLLTSYIRHQEKNHNRELHHLNFRHKDGNWLNYKVQNIFTDGKTVAESTSVSMFMNMFLSGQVLNKCCYSCPHINISRRGDLTLGDYWGVQYYDTKWPIADGIASIVASTDKGRKIVESLAQSGLIELYPQSFSKLYKGQPHSYNIKKRKRFPDNRSEVLEILRSRPLAEVHETCYNHIRICGLKVHRRSIWARLAKLPSKISSVWQKLFPSS